MSPNAPVGAGDRLAAPDVLRGVGVLGILAINILSFGLPEAARVNPEAVGGTSAADSVAWWVGYLLFDGKMVTLFSLLFGAGLVLQADRAAGREASPARLFYRRVFWLLIIGLLHAYFVWDGDILATYAVVGALVYPLRRLSARGLFVAGLVVMLPAVGLDLVAAAAVAEAQSAADAGGLAAADWELQRRATQPTPADVAAAVAARRGESYPAWLRRNADAVAAGHLALVADSFAWLTAGRILLGMALLKLGVLAGSRSAGFYWGLAVFGYGVGMPLVALDGVRLAASGYDPAAVYGPAAIGHDFYVVPVALGHVGLAVAVLKSGRLVWLTDRLAAVGRMALTNYLTQSLVCATLFNGYGFGLFGALGRAQLDGVMLTLWAVQLVVSPLWLRHFRFGPAEWLWRSLTYGRLQPLRVRSA